MTRPVPDRLCWPHGVPRTDVHRRQRGSFAVAALTSCQGILRSLKRMGAQDVVISTNLPVRSRDSLPLATGKEPEDPGVAVWWHFKAREMAMGVDRYSRVAHNLRALDLTLAAILNIRRWGSTQIMEQAFAGFALALPASPAPEPEPEPEVESPWREVLGGNFRVDIDDDDLYAIARARYELRRTRDGGFLNEDGIRMLDRAIAAAKRELLGVP